MPAKPTFREAFAYWFRLGFISFGGPTGQIAIMHKDLVEEKRWIDEEHFLQALNFCMLLPGPEAQQLTVYIGWLLHGNKGGIVAGLFFILPSIFILGGLTWLYAAYGQVPAVAAIFYGLKPAVVAIVAEAVLRIGKKSLRNEVLVGVAALSFLALYLLQLPFPAVILTAGLLGYAGGKWWPSKFIPVAKAKSTAADYVIHDDYRSSGDQANWRHTLKVLATGLPLWFAPLLAIGFWRGWHDTLVEIGLLFAKAAMVTFGGAYAVLAYISQQAVSQHGWLLPEQMIDGLGLAETTPGPLIMVTQFVGYLAAYQHAPGLSPTLAGVLGGLLTTWVTFVPCFIWIFVGAPYIEKVRKNAQLGSALATITAAVVGVVLNLALLFTHHVLLPEGGGFDGYALVASSLAFAGLLHWRWGMIQVIIASALAGYLWQTFL